MLFMNIYDMLATLSACVDLLIQNRIVPCPNFEARWRDTALATGGATVLAALPMAVIACSMWSLAIVDPRAFCTMADVFITDPSVANKCLIKYDEI